MLYQKLARECIRQRVYTKYGAWLVCKALRVELPDAKAVALKKLVAEIKRQLLVAKLRYKVRRLQVKGVQRKYFQKIRQLRNE